AAPGRAEYFPEFLESNRFPGDEQSEVLRDYLLRKYAGRRIDAVVALSSTALEFLRRYRSDLFRDVPIVFHTFGMPDLNDPVLRSNVTGVVADPAFRKTGAAALSLHPGTRQVLVIVGTPERDQKLEGDVRAELDDVESRVAIQYLSDLSLSDLMNGIKSAPPQSLIFYVRQSYDEPGNALDPYDMLGLVAGWSHVPVYSMSGGMLGRGSVGGYSADVEAAGAMVGRLALQIADG